MSPQPLNVSAPGTTMESSGLALLAEIAEIAANRAREEDMKASEETQGRQTRHMPNDAMAGCSNTKGRTISDFSVKVTGVSATSTVDAEKKTFLCWQCGAVLKSSRNLKRHISNLHEIKQRKKCPDCKKTFKNDGSLETHRFNEHIGSKKEYKCEQCEKTLQSSSHLKRHIKNVHTTEARKKCLYCTKTFKNDKSLDQHRKHEHTDNGKPYKCNQCDRAFAQPSTLKRHKLVHAGKRNHKHPDCKKTFKNNGSLETHRLSKHGSGKKEYKCKQCEKTLQSFSYLKQHIKHVHTTAVRKKCLCCAKTFKNDKSLDQHRKREHTYKGKPYKCNQCDHAFAYPSLLKKHKLVHAGKRNHEYPDCYKTCDNASSLDRHKLMQHSSRGKTRICIERGASFLCPDQMKRHKRTHAVERTGQKPFEGRTCNKKLFGRFSLIKHHQINNKNHLECKRYGKTFINKKNPDQHQCMDINKNNYDYPIYTCSALKIKKMFEIKYNTEAC